MRLGAVDRFAGWALLADGTPIDRIIVMHGDEEIGDCRYGFPRPDVSRAHPHHAAAAQSGFDGAIALRADLTKHLWIGVRDEAGRRHRLPGFWPRPATFLHGPWATALAAVDRTIHPDCEMIRHARSKLGSDAAATDHYFRAAEPLIHHLLCFAAEHRIDVARSSILDFASGYGRLTRHLVRIFASVTVSDTESAMLAFNAERFGAAGFLSSPSEPERLADHPRRYDLVFCFSLFSHLNEAAWIEWFEALFGLAEAGGFLLFSAHGYDYLKLLRADLAASHAGRDFNFWRANETAGRLDHETYGMTVVSPSFVERAAARVAGASVVQHYAMGAFDRFHDVYVIGRDAQRP